ncbi:LPS O-antigen length regulator [Leminorella grimontii]|uniref:LPS O-antigen length regulator n=1 Tax=Leminorella grimontii TaxID=82981 RepID=A0AAV5N4Y6_9GAMM|nr:LPS O-antigen length regulator Wzz(fepE) [Leminorella grimontii]KFC96908.1 ferric enterobactin uptake protein [Leminorella grimontii ATCC 33999 = DSM 5078]GKX56054.1 LPS O-antigen length regulator [Leminorella grimontii]VFS57792.1 Ferric enterobactin transport protein fepE [Leminorella grimontii]
MSVIENTLNKYPAPAPQQDEIDLFTLLEALLSAKKSLIAITFAFTVIGLVATFVLPQKWTSQAIVVPPEMPELIQLRKELVELQVLDIKADIDSATLFQQFIKRFDSPALQEEYLSRSLYIKKAFGEKEATPIERRRLMVSAMERLKLISNNSTNKKDALPYTSWTLSFTADNSEDAQSVLEGYIDYVSNAVERDVIRNLISALELRIGAEKDSLRLDRQALENEHNINIQRLNYSLEVANAAGIKQPVYSNGQAVKDDPDYSVALGSDGLAQKLKIEQSITDVAQLNASIQNREMRLNKMERISIRGAKLQPYRYQMTPSWPVKKDGPGKAIILTLSTMLGFMVACAYVLLSQAVQERARRAPTA